MFDVYCPEHGTNVLLTTRQIERFHNGPDGITVDWRCWCGTTGRLVRGRPAQRPPVAAAEGPQAADVEPQPEPLPEAV